jgi:SsrA-binding protein
MADNVIARNREALRDFHILEAMEAGIALSGTEVKSLRNRHANLTESFARLEKDEVFVYNLHISPYEQGSIFNPDPMRPRKLLLHRSQIRDLILKTRAKRLALIPLKLYFNKRGIAKLELALAKGKRQFDKREAIKERDHAREMQRAMRRKR